MDTLYPASPAQVPPQLTQATAVYKRHAWFAVAGLIFFVLLYLFFAGWFAYVAYVAYNVFVSTPTIGIGFFIGICAAFLAIFMLKALFFRDRSDLSGVIEITADQHPRLFEFLHRLADEADAPRPHRVFLSPRVNAAVFYDLSFFNLIWPSRKNLEIGLGLLNILTLAEFKAVCAHEFGHFAQRTMLVGRWVYVAQRIAGNIVHKRDALDKLLDKLSALDLRVAWLGWLLKLIVWSIRSLMDTMFSLVVLAQRSLSREMEMQADRVAVALTGSDALIHALYRLQAADDAWERALSFVSSEANEERAVSDVFAVQSRLLDLVGAFLNDPAYRQAPRPEQNPQQHRIFEPELAQPPRMWATHPFNHEREENAKEIYVAAPFDERSPWELFADPQKVREEMSAYILRGCEDLRAVPIEESLKTLEKAFERESLNPSYRGVYLGRSVVRHTARVEDLYDMSLSASADALAMLYPETLTGELERLRRQEKEVALLEALRDGRFKSPDGIIRYQGQRLSRRQLPTTIAAAQKELRALREKIAAHDCLCRSLHRHAAIAIGHGWEAYLVGLAHTLHYATHREADLLDAQACFDNAFAVATATRKVSGWGRKRILKAAEELYKVM
ncbi:MAG: M48 family metalloprotease, partial [Zoogloeaceae bacterium]|nr:M48 family metalloprotease [Zoogloeaceae bacterium]